MRNIFWNYRKSFIGLPFIPQAALSVTEGALILVGIPYALHQMLTYNANTYYDHRDSDIENI